MFTLTSLVTGAPQPLPYIIVAVPAATPPTIPVVILTVAIALLLLDQLPPEEELLNVVVRPIHISTVLNGVMAAGAALMVKGVVAIALTQPIE